MPFSSLDEIIHRTLPDARIEPVELPGCRQITLGLINSDYPAGPLAPDVMHAVIQSPAYWAFCWGSGLALARFLLADTSWVAGKTVVDLGSGSGVAGIAAALAGAAAVIACDTDPDARQASAVNAALNGTSIEVTDTLPASCDILLMADVLYDRQNLGLLEVARAHAAEILIADSRVIELPDPHYQEVARIHALTYPNLGEFDEFKTAHIFHYRSA